MLYKYLLIIGSAALFVAADSFSAHWAKLGNNFSLVLAIIAGSIGYVVFGILNQKMTLAVSGGMVNILLVAGAVLVSIFYFGEVITIKQGIGLSLAIAAILLMS